MPINDGQNPYYSMKHTLGSTNYEDANLDHLCLKNTLDKNDAFGLIRHKFKNVRYQLKHTYH